MLLLLQACASQPARRARAGAGRPPPAPARRRAGRRPATPAAARRRAGGRRQPAPLDAARLPAFDGERRDGRAEPLRGSPTARPHGAARRPVGAHPRRLRHAGPRQGRWCKQKTTQYAARPEYLQRIFDRSRLYLYHIVEEIEKRGLPTELALLPMVESAFNPMAYSRAHASGLWQFIPGTGKRFELEQNCLVRRPARHRRLHQRRARLPDQALQDARRLAPRPRLLQLGRERGGARDRPRTRPRSKTTDYASLRMPKETRHYIPKLQALKNIIADPAAFGIDLDPIPNQPYFAVVTETAATSTCSSPRSLAEMPVEEFIALNPGFSRPLIRASATPRIVLPADKVDAFHDNLAKLDEAALVSWKVYQPEARREARGDRQALRHERRRAASA